MTNFKKVFKMNTWNIAYAKSNFAAVIKRSEDEPQLISRRNKPVAVIMNVEQYDKSTIKKSTAASMKDSFAELKMIQKKEKVVIDIPERKDREDALQL